MKLQRERERLIAVSIKKQQTLQSQIKQLTDQAEKLRRQKEAGGFRGSKAYMGVDNGQFDFYNARDDDQFTILDQPAEPEKPLVTVEMEQER